MLFILLVIIGCDCN
ncbi:sporulation protein YjcZ [Brevibacillus centrosporus]|nr:MULTISPECIES: sporulation protein YjcZ [Brevibacillus]MEC2128972.1 sporulation protein YjcZ [Brevibacillus centrosporus]MED1795389.1 sporulation protein YjcZ [Brevibacillus nitrificans]MED1951939.1 sporulation protein YjcZ [Brevibacillus centrosporus]MED4910090.1 sporulation protein YjcZ [Brevibacillus centrosporus]